MVVVGQRTLVVPCRHFVVEVVFIHVLDAVLGSGVGIYHSLDERVASQAVATMQTRARALAEGIEAVDAGASVEIDLDTTAHVVGSRANRDVFLGDVDADAEALRIDVREVVLGLLRVLVGDVETNMVETMNLHLLVDGTSHDVARGKAQAPISFSDTTS